MLTNLSWSITYNFSGNYFLLDFVVAILHQVTLLMLD